MLTNNEKLFISEQMAAWEGVSFRYWEALPTPEFGNTRSELMAEAAQTKPALVLIHGFGASVEHFRRTFLGMRGRYRIYGLDLVGFAGSAQHTYGLEEWARQVNALLVLKNEERAVLVGHGLGGLVAVRVSQLYAAKVAGLVLLDSVGLPSQEGANVSWAKKIYEADKTPLVGHRLALRLLSEAGVRRNLENIYWNKQKVTPQLVQQWREPLSKAGAGEAYIAIARKMANYQLKIEPDAIKVPTLLVWGQYDGEIPPEVGLTNWRKRLPQAETFVVKDAGHCPHDERPDLFNPRLMQFVEKALIPATS